MAGLPRVEDNGDMLSLDHRFISLAAILGYKSQLLEMIKLGETEEIFIYS